MTDEYQLYPSTAHAIACGMNNGRPVIACVCGLPNKDLGGDQIPPMPEAKMSRNPDGFPCGIDTKTIEAHARDLAARLASSQALAGELAEALEKIQFAGCTVNPTAIAAEALAKFKEATR